MPQPAPAPPALNSFDEFTRLDEVVLGRADHYDAHHTDTSWRLFFYDNVAPVLGQHTSPSGEELLPIPTQLVDELNEDIAGLADALTGCGVNVLRPATPGKDVDIRSPHWDARATPPLNVRDQTIILGNTIVETASHVRARAFENDLLKPVFYRYYKDGGANWLSMPRPALARGSLDTSYFTRQGLDVARATDNERAGTIEGLGLEMVFDGAQCMRLGRDVLVNVANHNHELALRWLRDNLRDLHFHRLDAMADNHIDSVLVPLRPGLMLLRSPEYLKFLPEAMQSWDVIYAPETDDRNFPDYSDIGFVIPIGSRYMDINLLSIDENTVVVNSLYPELIKVLEARGFTVVPVRHRHRRLFGGGYHCFTLDTVRRGGPEDYLS
ncbi:inosamine-phosphate amidinotransferase 1 [Streptomyces sp. WI03-5b]|uniref:inosamine-phosphate amidinotransferase 1 n=1 Tax=Streptomyces sp. WI03-5b TaxID=462946 RepID=UPI0029B7C9E7|nr:inosamine-phosphate amidinotransferase 1 [Streptomyces sp. WI03-5b]MDX2624494.1 inosamine-phosphate amidinotransferase 1 [Streptomyces sp. WI03-5b]